MSAAHPLLDSPPEACFDNLTALAVKLLEVPVSLVSILDTDRQFFKSQCGLSGVVASARGTPLTHSFCRYAVEAAKPFVVDDARVHELVRNNPVVRKLGVAAYLGVPLFTPAGVAYGAFCALDTTPRRWSERDTEILQLLAGQVMTEINLRVLWREQSLKFQNLLNEEPREGAGASSPDSLLGNLLLCLRAVSRTGALTPEQNAYLQAAERNATALRGDVTRAVESNRVAPSLGS